MCKLKPGWRKVKFGEVVRQAKSKVDPETSGLERYVAGEHMDTDDLRIRRWGEIGNGYLGPAFHVRFRPGQVLYGSRRTYLRKVAVADFEGICANTTFVLESASPTILLPELLPFLMQTDTFHEHSKRESKGSVNPYVNFTDLAWYEFALPPLGEQSRIVRILSAVDTTLSKWQETLEAISLVREALFADCLKAILGVGARAKPIRDAAATAQSSIYTGSQLLERGILTALQDGNHGSQYPKAKELGDKGYPYLSASDISEDGKIELSSCRRILPERAKQLRIPPAQGGDVILCNNATVGRIGQIPPWDTPIVASTSTTYYRTNEKHLLASFLRRYMESNVFQHQLRRVMKQSTRDQVPITAQKQLLFIVPPIREQSSVVSRLARVERQRDATTGRIEEARRLRRFLLAMVNE